MIAESAEKVKGKHVGRNLQRIRVYLGIKQEALAADLGISQQEVSKIENQEEIDDDLLTKIAGALGVSPEVIKDFDLERTIYNINNIRENTFGQGPTSIGSASTSQQFNPIDKIVELYERLLQSEREKIELLKKK